LADLLRILVLPGTIADDLAVLVGKVYAPFVVAILDRVKVGKNNFIDTMLGAIENLAAVGATETPATINNFRYGHPADPERPARCYWRGGGYDDRPGTFAHHLQSNDREIQRRAGGINQVECRLPGDYLRRVILVDTPGTTVVVDQRQGRTAENLIGESKRNPSSSML